MTKTESILTVNSDTFNVIFLVRTSFRPSRQVVKHYTVSNTAPSSGQTFLIGKVIELSFRFFLDEVRLARFCKPHFSASNARQLPFLATIAKCMHIERQIPPEECQLSTQGHPSCHSTSAFRDRRPDYPIWESWRKEQALDKKCGYCREATMLIRQDYWHGSRSHCQLHAGLSPTHLPGRLKSPPLLLLHKHDPSFLLENCLPEEDPRGGDTPQ